jgi:hypothetical protein
MCYPTKTEPIVFVDCDRCDCPTSGQYGIHRGYQYSPTVQKCIDCNKTL